MTPDDYARAAADLLTAEKTGKQIGLLSLRHPEIGMSDAYAIQNAIYRQKLAQGRRVIGWKIGLTSKAMQNALNIDTPDSGTLFDDMACPNGSTVPAGRFIQPRIEAEIAFVMKSALGGESVTRSEVLAATDHVVPSIEILDTRIRRTDPGTGKARTIFDTISDNAANAGIVLGDQRHLVDDIDLRWVGVMAFRNGEVEETGLGAGVLNDPVESVAWLARRMAAYGQKIEPGHVVLSGSFIRPVECPPGTEIHADFGSFGKVDIGFAQGDEHARTA
jgi:2-oxo-hept-3-ene-1,7-dioate hydratase